MLSEKTTTKPFEQPTGELGHVNNNAEWREDCGACRILLNQTVTLEFPDFVRVGLHLSVSVTINKKNTAC